MNRLFKKRRIVVLLFLVLFLYQPTHDASAVDINYGIVFREHRVFEPGAFIGVADYSGMSTSSELVDVVHSDALDPDYYANYQVRVTSDSPRLLDTFLQPFRLLSYDRSHEYAKAIKPPDFLPPGDDWGGVTYTFQVYDVVGKSVSGVPSLTWYIPDGDVTNPVPVPEWVSFSGDCSSLYVEWEDVLGNLGRPTYTGHYRIRIYRVDQHGRLGYDDFVYRSNKFPEPYIDLPFNLCGDCETDPKSYAIGIQTRINVAGADPLGGGLVNRSQYYFRYDTCDTVGPTLAFDGAFDAGDNRKYLAWFGWYNDQYWPWIWDYKYGCWLWVVDNGPENVWFWHETGQTWMWTRTDWYKWVRFAGDATLTWRSL